MTSALVLAAGRSRRMGASKLLLPILGSTVIARVVDAFRLAPVASITVVVRPNDVAIRGAVADRSVRFVENPEPDGDMLNSARHGLRALPSSTTTILLSPGDLPRLEPALIRQMLTGYRESGRSILVPVYAGRRGHPLLFAARFRDEILSGYDGVGVRGLLGAHPADVCEWPSPDGAVLEDLDTPADYGRTLSPEILPRSILDHRRSASPESEASSVGSSTSSSEPTPPRTSPIPTM